MEEIGPISTGQESDYVEPQSIAKMIQTLEMEEDANKRLVAKLNSLLGTSNFFVQGATTAPIAGDAAANGTALLQIVIPINRRFILTKLKVVFVDTAGPAPAGIRIGTAAALPVVAANRLDIVPLPQAAAGEHSELVDGQSPLLVVNGGAAGTILWVYVPALFLTNAANNAATRTFEASYAGLLI